jgi:uncharacterized protein
MTESGQAERSLISRIFISPNEKRLRAGWRLLIHFVAFVILFILLSIPVGIAQYAGLSDTFVFLGSQAAFFIALTVTTWLARRFIDKRSFVSLGFRRPLAVRDYAVGFVVAGIIMGAIYVAEWALGWLKFEGFAWQQESAVAVLSGLGVWAIIFIIGAWQEELLARGYWLQNMAEGVNLPFGLILSSILFGLLHGGNPNISIIALLLLMVAGVFLAYGYLQTKQLWLGIGLHMGWNYFEGNIFGFQVSGLDTFRLIHQTVNGPDWITGGVFGPEAGLIVLPAMALGVALIYAYVKYWRPKPAPESA